jgi:hypothetical protein
MPANEAQKDIISQHLHLLLNNREWPKTICPSELARALSSSELARLEAQSWRDVIPDIREVVWALRECVAVEVLQKGVVTSVSLEDVHGAIRVRYKRQNGMNCVQ